MRIVRKGAASEPRRIRSIEAEAETQTPIENAPLWTSVLLASGLVVLFAGFVVLLFAIKRGEIVLGEIGDLAFRLLLLLFAIVGSAGVGTWVVRSD